MDRSFSSVTNFINYLKSHGYPEDSFVTEFLINNKYSADLAIIEPKTKEIIALIEFKKRRNIKTEELAIKQLTNIYRAVNDRTVQIYLVYSDDETQLFDVYVFQEKNGSFYLSPTGISNYLITKNTKLSKELINNKKNQKKTNNILLIICISLSVILTSVLIIDFIGLLEITINRLIIIGIITALLVIPYANKIKFLGIEWERLREKE